MTTPESKIYTAQQQDLLTQIGGGARVVTRNLRGAGDKTPTEGQLKAICGAANGMARAANKLTGQVIERTGRGAKIAALKAENKMQRAALQAVADFVAGKPGAIEPFQLVRDALGGKGGAA